MSQHDFTDAEVEELKSLLPYVEQMKEEAEYRAARRLVLQTWRQSIIALSSLIAAIYVFRDHIARFLTGE